MKLRLYIIFTRLAYLAWVAWCIATCAVFSISLLAFDNTLGVLIALIMGLLAPNIYQYGLDHWDFEAASKILEFDFKDEDET